MTTLAIERTERIRGRALQRIRERFFDMHPLCQCKNPHCPHHSPGIQHIAAAKILDHIVPLHKGGTNDESNYQGLCDPCNDFKTTTEQGKHAKPYEPQGLDWL